MRSALAVALSLVVATAACKSDKKPQGTDPAVVTDAMAAVADRLRVVSDYSYEGVAENLDNGEKVTFSYALRQPRMLRADVKEMQTSFIFDGTNLAVIEGANKRVLRQDLSKKDEVTIVGALHQMFESYSVEGWRPPMLRTKREALSGRVETGEGGPVWVITSALDDPDLKEVRYYLRPPRADFVKKEFVAKDGSVVASSTVLEEKLDEKTRLRFPIAWEHRDARRRYRVRLSETQVNPGLGPERFQIKAPEGFAVEEVGAGG